MRYSKCVSEQTHKSRILTLSTLGPNFAMGVEFIFFRKVLKFVVTVWAKTYQKFGYMFFVIA